MKLATTCKSGGGLEVERMSDLSASGGNERVKLARMMSAHTSEPKGRWIQWHRTLYQEAMAAEARPAQ